MQIRRSRLVAALAAVVLVAAGCTKGKSDPTTPFTPTATMSSPTPSSSAPSTPSSSPPVVATTGPNVRPGEKPPVLPATAKANTTFGAIQFAEFWIKTLDWGYATTDATLEKTLFDPSCSECARFTGIIESAKQHGEHFVGGRIAISSAIAAQNDGRSGATMAVDCTYSQQATHRESSDGTVLATSAGVAKLERRIWVKWTGTHFVVVETRQIVRK